MVGRFINVSLFSGGVSYTGLYAEKQPQLGISVNCLQVSTGITLGTQNFFVCE